MDNLRIRGKSDIAMLPLRIPLKYTFEIIGVLHLAEPKSDDSMLLTDQSLRIKYTSPVIDLPLSA